MTRFLRPLIIITMTFLISNMSSNLASMLSGEYKEEKILEDIGFKLINENLELLTLVDNYISLLLLGNIVMLLYNGDFQYFERIVNVICLSYLQRSYS